jgi:hypothetical protein
MSSGRGVGHVLPGPQVRGERLQHAGRRRRKMIEIQNVPLFSFLFRIRSLSLVTNAHSLRQILV